MKVPEEIPLQTYLANPGGFTYYDVIFRVNIRRIIINIQDLHCDRNISDKAGIIYKEKWTQKMHLND